MTKDEIKAKYELSNGKDDDRTCELCCFSTSDSPSCIQAMQDLGIDLDDLDEVVGNCTGTYYRKKDE